MSAALQLPMVWGMSVMPAGDFAELERLVREEIEKPGSTPAPQPAQETPEKKPPVPLAFYRKHTEKLLRRYLYASMQVGRAPSILGDPIGRGWVSSRPVRTFEDAVIFVLDVESCLNKLDALDKALLAKVMLQDYTQSETAALLGMSIRTVTSRLPIALDLLTERLLQAGLLDVPHSKG